MTNLFFSRVAEQLRAQKRGILDWWDTATDEKRMVRLGDRTPAAIEDHLHVLDDAISRAETEELGRCTVCHGFVESHWLETNYTSSVCIEHLTGEERSRLEAELELSQKVQRALLPQQVPSIPDWELAAYSRPASIVGGDYFDFLKFRDGAPAVIIADVMGKGMPASMLMASLQATLRIIVPEAISPEEVLVRANRLFCHNIYLTKFVSLAIFRLEPGARSMRYANAGHNPPLVCPRQPASSVGIRSLRPTGAAIGLLEETRFGSEHVPLERGDLLLAFTDGVVETRSASGEEYGEERLRAFLAARREEPPHHLIGMLRQDLEAFAGGAPPHDDTTIIAARCTTTTPAD